MKQICIAYGRNLDIKRMKQKCPHAKLLGKAQLYGWTIDFGKYITLIPDENKVVPVGLWQIDEIALSEIDAIEGYPNLYRRETVQIEFNNKLYNALIYLLNDPTPYALPLDYIDRLKIGYNDFNFDFKIIQQAINKHNKKPNLIVNTN